MQTYTCVLSSFTVITTVVFGPAAMASDLPKEGTFSGTYFAVATVKAVPVGKERMLLTFDQNGVSVGEGLSNHFTWHCWGLGDYTSGMGQDHGHRVGTNPAGEQIVLDFSDEKHPMDQKIVHRSFTLTTGTGNMQV